MASGKAIGEFSFKLVAINNSPGPAGSVLIQVSWEGTGTGFGAIFNTVTYVGGPKNGTFSECATAYLDNGDGLSGIGQGPMKAPENTGGARRALCRSPMAAGSLARAKSTWPLGRGRGRYSRAEPRGVNLPERSVSAAGSNRPPRFSIKQADIIFRGPSLPPRVRRRSRS